VNEVQGRFANAWRDATKAAAVPEQRRVERSYKRMLALTDEVLSRLEQRNLAGQRDLDPVMRRNIDRALRELPPRAQGRFPAARSVQEALDGIFEVQAELLVVLERVLHWDRVRASRRDMQGEAGIPLRTPSSFPDVGGTFGASLRAEHAMPGY
jgi:hypothetical protein